MRAENRERGYNVEASKLQVVNALPIIILVALLISFHYKQNCLCGEKVDVAKPPPYSPSSLIIGCACHFGDVATRRQPKALGRTGP